jgi:hypothetical protein
VLFIDNDLEVMPGAVELLLHQFDVVPDTNATTGRVVMTDGSIQLCGAGFNIQNGVRVVDYFRSGQIFDTRIEPSGECLWVPGCLALIRTALVREHPFDSKLQYFEDNEWALRVHRAGIQGFRWVSDAVALHNLQPKFSHIVGTPARRGALMPYLADLARISSLDGYVYGEVFALIPELGSPTNPAAVQCARLCLDLITELGHARFLEMWLGGQLDPVFSSNPSSATNTLVRSRARMRDEAMTHEATVLRASVDALEAELAAEREKIGALQDITDLLEDQLAQFAKLLRHSAHPAVGHSSSGPLSDRLAT